MSKPIGLGFVGCGKHAFRAHANVAVQLDWLFSIVSAFDPNSLAAAHLAELSSSARSEKSAENLLANPEVDAVVIATPHQFHLELMEKAIEAGKHVFCEKPLWVGDGADRFREILRKAGEKKLVVTSCHPRRFEPDYLELCAHMDEFRTQFGKPVEFNFRFFYHKPPTGWKQEDSLLLDHMNHEIDIANFILGSSMVHLRRVFDSYDRYQVVGRRDDGVSLNFSGYRCLEDRVYTNELEIVFERGRVKVISMLKDSIVMPTVFVDNFEVGLCDVIKPANHLYDVVFRSVMESFAAAIKNGKNYLTPEDLMTNTNSCNSLIATGEYQS